jgi:hypothetical protein
MRGNLELNLTVVPCMNLIRWKIVGMMVAAFALQAGCHRTTSTGDATVHGLVTFQGQPVAGGLVVFSPDRERGEAGKPISAEISPDGKFQLKIGGSAAIPPGWYRVAIAPAPNATTILASVSSAFPPQLARPDKSGLIRQVKPGQENLFEFIIEASNQ